MNGNLTGGKVVKSERVNIRLSQEDRQRLQDLVTLSNSDTMTDVIVKALIVYEALVKQECGTCQVIDTR